MSAQSDLDYLRRAIAVSQAARDHGNMKGRHQAYAVTFLGTINTYIGLHLNGRLKLDRRLAERVIHQFMHGILS